MGTTSRLRPEVPSAGSPPAGWWDRDGNERAALLLQSQYPARCQRSRQINIGIDDPLAGAAIERRKGVDLDLNARVSLTLQVFRQPARERANQIRILGHHHFLPRRQI